jgi:hypothetical protein
MHIWTKEKKNWDRDKKKTNAATDGCKKNHSLNFSEICKFSKKSLFYEESERLYTNSLMGIHYEI